MYTAGGGGGALLGGILSELVRTYLMCCLLFVVIRAVTALSIRTVHCHIAQCALFCCVVWIPANLKLL